MFKNFSKDITPQPSSKWTGMIENKRIELINAELRKSELYKDFEVTKAPENGQVEIKIERIIAANQRGMLLLDLEEMLKEKIDKGITVWCHPVKDKSKLRNLRGVNFAK